jgi:hypothetical protein
MYKMQRLEVSGAVRHIYIYVVRRLRVKTPSTYRAVNTFYLGYKNLSVYVVWGRGHCLFSDKYKPHKYSVGRMLNVKPVGSSRNQWALKVNNNNSSRQS